MLLHLFHSVRWHNIKHTLSLQSLFILCLLWMFSWELFIGFWNGSSKQFFGSFFFLKTFQELPSATVKWCRCCESCFVKGSMIKCCHVIQLRHYNEIQWIFMLHWGMFFWRLWFLEKSWLGLFFCFLSDAARESPAEYLSFLPLSSALSSPFYFSTLQYQLYQIPPSLCFLVWAGSFLPELTHCVGMQREKRKGRRNGGGVGRKNHPFFFFSALIISTLDSLRKNKTKQRFTNFLNAVSLLHSSLSP